MLRYIGPSSSDAAMRRAGDEAYHAVDSAPGRTYVSVLERFDRSTTTGAPGTQFAGELLGELWIADAEGVAELERQGVDFQEVDGYGYTVPDELEADR